jgi:hypothetical protein
MTQQIIDIGNVANDGTGTPIRESFRICNENFTQLFAVGGVTGIQNGNSNVQIQENSNVTVSSNGVANVMVVSSTGVTVSGAVSADSATFGSGVGGNISGANFISANAFVASSSVTTEGIAVTGNVATVTSANYAIGYRDQPQLTTFSTLTATVGGKHFYGSGNITIPTDAAVPLAVGTTVEILASGSANVVPDVGVTLHRSPTGATGTQQLNQHAWVNLIKVSSNVWYISGVGMV